MRVDGTLFEKVLINRMLMLVFTTLSLLADVGISPLDNPVWCGFL